MSIISIRAVALPGDWQSDFDQAVAKAKEMHKGNLVVFTGLKWEEWSRKLNEEVLSHVEFSRKLSEPFVLTQIDLPQTPKSRDKANEAEVRQYELAKKFKLQKLPSIYLCTSDGRPCAVVGYEKGGPEVVVEAIESKWTAYAEAMKKIDQAKGPKRALAIDEWLQTIPGPIQSLYHDKMEMIIESDPNNETGLWHKYKMALMIPKARELRYTGKLDQSEKIYLEIVNDVKPTGEELQNVYYELGDVYFQQKDYSKLLDDLDRAIQAAPEGPRISVLNEMMEVFTRQSVYARLLPDRMKAVNYDYKQIELSPEDRKTLLKLIDEAKKTAPESTRNQVLDKMKNELFAPNPAGG